MPFEPDRFKKTVSIPIRIVNGQLAYFYGGELPRLREHTIGELIVPASAVTEPKSLASLQEEHVKEIRPANTKLLLGMRAKAFPAERRTFVIYPEGLFPRIDYGFIEVRLKEPLCLRLRGSKKATLESCRCFIPALDQEAKSLNHAYTLISGSPGTAVMAYRYNGAQDASLHVQARQTKVVRQLTEPLTMPIGFLIVTLAVLWLLLQHRGMPMILVPCRQSGLPHVIAWLPVRTRFYVRPRLPIRLSAPR
jgi:hypothetical protein